MIPSMETYIKLVLNSLHMSPEELIFTKYVLSAIIGFLVGLTRKKNPAGERTFALICLGSCIFASISIMSFNGQADPTRIIGQIVSGIGFLGLGVIWKNSSSNKPRGLTTAAGVWVTAALGVLIGIEMWKEAIIGTIITMLVIYYNGPRAAKIDIKKITKNHNIKRI